MDELLTEAELTAREEAMPIAAQAVYDHAHSLCTVEVQIHGVTVEEFDRAEGKIGGNGGSFWKTVELKPSGMVDGEYDGSVSITYFLAKPGS